MPFPRSLLTVGAMLTLAYGLLASAASSTEFLVLSFSGVVLLDGTPPVSGAELSEQTTIRVSKNSQLSIVSKDGKLIIDGPFEGKLAGRITKSASPISFVTWGFLFKLFQDNVAFSSRGVAGAQFDGWAVRIDTSGIKCIRTGELPRIQVDPELIGQRAILVDIETDKDAEVRFSSQVIPWPTELTFSDGNIYSATINGTGKSFKWQLRFVDAALLSSEETLLALKKLDCTEQLLAFVAEAPADMIVR